MNIEAIVIDKEERMLGIQLLCHYYRGDLLKLSLQQWDELIELLKSQSGMNQNETFRKAFTMLEEISPETIGTFQYEYNRLFVGPNVLLASPYESSYTNYEGMLMGQETMTVRNFYYHSGLKVAEEGKYPDDHIAFELEFLLHLIDSEENDEQQSVHQIFLEKHLLKWCPKHIERIIENSQNVIPLAFAYLLKGLLQIEKSMIEGGE